MYDSARARQIYCVAVVRVVVFPASRSFQLRIVLNPRKNVPCVCQRQNGRMANDTTWPWPTVMSTIWAAHTAMLPCVAASPPVNKSREEQEPY